jgi:glutamine amidotransferase
MGNRRSVEKALARAGASVRVTGDPERLARANGLVVPGVGAFPKAMESLKRLGLDEVIRARAAAGTPILGLCLGMQIMFEASAEHAETPGLGLLAGTVEVLPADGLKLPHIGWNRVTWQRPSPLIAGLPEACAFYHVHSYAARPADESDVLGLGEYATPFVSAVARPPLFGVQFHPEKSSTAGLALLRNFVDICARVPVAQEGSLS